MQIRIEGHVDPRFWPVARALERMLERGGGGAVCVYHRGEKVVDLWGGTRDATGRPWRHDTMAMSFSTSKGVVATLLHLLADRGLLAYDDAVASHWPEFGANGKHSITVRQLLSHRAGLPRIRPLIDRGERILDWSYMVDALAAATPNVQPDGRSAYHALTFGWLAGELAQRVTGRSLQDLLREELAEPLELDGLYIGAPAQAKRRAAILHGQLGASTRWLDRVGLAERAAGPLTRLYRTVGVPLDPKLMLDALVPPGDSRVLFEPRILDVPVPAANGLFTARSLARMYAVLAEGGVLDGRRLLSRSTVEKLSEVQTRERDRVVPVRMQWRLGYHAAFTTRGRIRSAFGHFGYGGSGAWADPERRLAVAMVNNRIAGSPFGDQRIASIGTAALSSLRNSSPARSRAGARLAPRLVTAATKGDSG